MGDSNLGRTKESLIQENKNLRNTIKDLKTKLDYYVAVDNENAKFKAELEIELGINASLNREMATLSHDRYQLQQAQYHHSNETAELEEKHSTYCSKFEKTITLLAMKLTGVEKS